MAAKNVILEEAKAEANMVSRKAIEQTKLLLEREREGALAALKDEVATLSVQIAEKLLQSELQPKSTQEKLVQQLIKEAHWG